jgi:hypothetical protein
MLGFLRRKPKLAADRRPVLEPDERILAWADTPGEHVLVATNRGLWLPERPRLGWHEINKAAWSGRELRITPGAVAEQYDGWAVLVDEPVLSYLLLEPGDIPENVRARVTRSVAYTSHHPLPGAGRGVRIVARRVSGVDGLSWTARFDTNTAVDEPDAVEVVGGLVGQARESATPAV